MAKKRWSAWLVLGLASVPGCMSPPGVSNPLRVQPGMVDHAVENPIFVPHGYEGYEQVWDKTYDAVDEFFDIAYSTRYDGRIETFPLLTGGYFEPGRLLPSHEENLEATFQTVRRRGIVLITPADNGGYYIEVQVLKELEDLPEPIHGGRGAAVLQPGIPLDRRDDIVLPEICSAGWIPIGRDHAMEQAILAKLRKCL